MIDKNALKALEFNKIVQIAQVFSTTVHGSAFIRTLRPLNSINKIDIRLKEISQCRRLLIEHPACGIENIESLLDVFKQIKPKDSILQPYQLRKLLPLFNTALNLRYILKKDNCDLIVKLLTGMFYHSHIKRQIESAIDTDGVSILDDASEELSSIRNKIRSAQNKIKKALELILKRKELSSHLQDTYVTQRNGRWVIPVKKDSKSRIRGILHDISNSGETVFIEPFEIQNLGNNIDSLKMEEKLEEYRILKALSDLVRGAIWEIKQTYSIVIRFDALIALALFANSLKMTEPQINEKGVIKIIQGIHPLLWKSFKGLSKESAIVPLDFKIGGAYGDAYKGMVITGSNTGGKTVVLKTIGALSLMALSGMHIPAKEGTTLPFLENVLVDIGDDQSIEDNLSTFSAHIKRINDILSKSAEKTLVLIDELGTSTDPDQGAALACAILKEIVQKGSLVIATTHLKALKVFAHSEAGFVNGSMEMEIIKQNDALTYRPSYRLSIGSPGESYAFEIAQSLGISREIITQARIYMDTSSLRFEKMVEDLNSMSKEYSGKLIEINRLKEELSVIVSSRKTEINELKNSKKQVMVKAYDEAKEIIRKTKLEAIEALEEIKKSDTKKAAETVKVISNKLAQTTRKHQALLGAHYSSLSSPVIGQKVFVKDLNIEGILSDIHLKKNRCIVNVKGRELEVAIDKLAPIGDKAKEDTMKSQSDKSSATQADKIMESRVSMELKLIGQRVDPALTILERYLNDASMDELRTVRIIHGIGTGALSAAVKDYLKGHPLVKSFRKATDEEGAGAVTIVELK
ncbi:recombination and DNA strand exchange inhibitor protein [Candidatus Magnetoovum chiemensis]|nr:recombination and DNA strand exchange inhibitor protein [Candidatus Magnetoovum chiemensis]